ncbi:MAG: hypothetical protein HY037_06600 [Nitrospirae bacterium]|nr:hypothetical protein [Candidatus Troglogloeales bacterium]
MSRSNLKNHKRIVVKIGSNVIASRERGLDETRMEEIACEISEMRRCGATLFIVSSGAILCGAKAMGLTDFPETLPMKQAAAAVGQSCLMWAYERLFIRHQIKVAQILLTRNDLSNKNRYLNARNTLLATGYIGGTGGMASKVATAKKVAASGVTTLILNGTRPGMMKQAFQGEELGTLFLPKVVL